MRERFDKELEGLQKRHKDLDTAVIKRRNEYEVSAGSMIYAPPGIAGAHEWEVKESLELLDIRATNETNRKIQYTVDKKTMRS